MTTYEQMLREVGQNLDCLAATVRRHDKALSEIQAEPEVEVHGSAPFNLDESADELTRLSARVNDLEEEIACIPESEPIPDAPSEPNIEEPRRVLLRKLVDQRTILTSQCTMLTTRIAKIEEELDT